jgi:hypothetical protein
MEGFKITLAAAALATGFAWTADGDISTSRIDLGPLYEASIEVMADRLSMLVAAMLRVLARIAAYWHARVLSKFASISLWALPTSLPCAPARRNHLTAPQKSLGTFP